MNKQVLTFPCPQCGKALRSTAQNYGKKGVCPVCKGGFIVPAAFDGLTPAEGVPVLPGDLPGSPVLSSRSTVGFGSLARNPLILGSVGLLIIFGLVLTLFKGRGNESSPPIAKATALAPPPPVSQVTQPPPVAATQPVTTSPSAALTANERAIEELKAERDRLQHEVDLRNEKEQLVKEVERLKQPPAATPAQGPQPVLAATSQQGTQPVPVATLEVASKPSGLLSIAEVNSSCGPEVVVVTASNLGGTSTGAGFLAFAPNLIVTNHHVVHGGNSFTAAFSYKLSTGRTTQDIVACQVVAVDAANDLALLSLSNDAPTGCKPLDFADPATLQAGQEVVAIGNPGLGGQILEKSVTNGIVSAIEREIEGRRYIQTTAAINPGNSGGPLLDLHGRVVGVVSAKAIKQENIGFAVSVSYVQALFQERAGKFKVEGPFAAWEEKIPGQALRAQPGAMAIDEVVADLKYDAESKLLVAALPERNKVAVISPATGKIVHEVFAGTDPAAIRLVGRGKAWVSHLSSKNVALIDIRSGKLDRKMTLTDIPVDFAASQSAIWYMSPNGFLHMLTIADGIDHWAPVNIRSLICVNLKNHLFCGSADGGLCEVDGDSLGELMGPWDDVTHELEAYQGGSGIRVTADSAQYPALVRKQAKLSDDIKKCIRYLAKGANLNIIMPASRQFLLFDAKNAHIFSNCSMFDAKSPDKIIGTFKNPEHTMNEHGDLEDLYKKYPFLKQIIGVSPDGVYACSGTHLFKTDDFTVVQQLPVPTPAVEFSPDSKTLWISDVFNRQIIPVDLAKLHK